MYILLLSIHGLIRGNGLELGRDADTGGQTLYVVDLARALAERDDVDQVDLVTRRIVDPAVSGDYAEPVEPLSQKARILRIDAGPDEYIPKERLWDHLDGFMDNLVTTLNAGGRMPDLIHSHYADAGYVGVRLSNLLGVPLVHTGHSLGRDKRQRLLSAGVSEETINQTYHMDRRVDAEEEVLAGADLVIASTNHEIDEQYGLYDYYQPGRMAVIPPGTDLSRFYPPASSVSTRGDPPSVVPDQIRRFLQDPDKPLILALSRADARKNNQTLLEAYGESDDLRETANLLIVAGNRDDIRDLDEGARSVLTELLIGIDAYNLYGRVAMPKHLPQDQVAELYRLAAERGGIFVNPALTEPFGLTLLEAAASGLPLVATENGGPVDIIGNCDNGILVDPLDKAAIAQALLKLLTDPKRYRRMRDNGVVKVREHYSWPAHAERYLGRAKPLLKRHEPIPLAPKRGKRYRDRALFTDIDQSLLGDAEGIRQFVTAMHGHRKCATFGIATGRRLDTALAELKRHSIPHPDVLITSLGTEIHYAPRLARDQYWNEHIDYLWRPATVLRVLSEFPGLEPQPKREQTHFKVSYHYDPDQPPDIEELTSLLRSRDVTANLIQSFGRFLDVVPSRASKGQALRYVAQRWGIPLERILVAGGSGADEDMMRGNTLAVVVANRHGEELSQLADLERIYFAGQPYALGILEAVDHYDFFGSCELPTTGS
ncbi:HAD-IIB family hydrolase [Candidatus Thiosymbion oneisti]|uniref:HAD-IIB family hydrolase n=1 Tax=Candidatus Thiosymbion oneisti TaxID=589554 RepID=UPI000AD2834A|nr:HAD-IIB family hydrolase [Candidatus Thiosymbion oneisti]